MVEQIGNNEQEIKIKEDINETSDFSHLDIREDVHSGIWYTNRSNGYFNYNFGFEFISFSKKMN